MHLLSTACTTERREKSHYDDAGGQQTMLCQCVGGCQDKEGLHNTDKMSFSNFLSYEDMNRDARAHGL